MNDPLTIKMDQSLFSSEKRAQEVPFFLRSKNTNIEQEPNPVQNEFPKHWIRWRYVTVNGSEMNFRYILGEALSTTLYVHTFFEWRVTDFVRPVALRRYKSLGPGAGRIGHRASDHALSVLGHRSRIHDEIGRWVQENA